MWLYIWDFLVAGWQQSNVQSTPLISAAWECSVIGWLNSEMVKSLEVLSQTAVSLKWGLEEKLRLHIPTSGPHPLGKWASEYARWSVLALSPVLVAESWHRWCTSCTKLLLPEPVHDQKWSKGGQSHQDGWEDAITWCVRWLGIPAAWSELVTLACASSQERRRFSSCLLALPGLVIAVLWYSSSALALKCFAFSSSSQRWMYCRRDLRRDDKDSFLNRERNRFRKPGKAVVRTSHSSTLLIREVPVSEFKWVLSFKWRPVFSLPLLPKFRSSKGAPGFPLQLRRDLAILRHVLQGAREHLPPQQESLEKKAADEVVAEFVQLGFGRAVTGTEPAFAGDPSRLKRA